jgi:hypothetical protein
VPSASPAVRGGRQLAFERLEPRRLLAADLPEVDVGAVYTELTSSGEESEGDQFEVTWSGGAPGTQLTQLVISGDQDGNGFDDGDVFFDPAPGGPGAGAAFPFTVVSAQGIDSVTASVSADGLTLTLNVVGWDPGERLIFTIDVDEQDDGPNSLVEGAEFQQSVLSATFVDQNGHHETVTGSGRFRDAYDHLVPPSLDLPLDSQLPPGEGTNVRTAGTGFTLQQPVLPFTISGTVYHDVDLDGQQDPTESGIAGVQLELQELRDGTYVSTGLTTTTAEDGSYAFVHDCPGTFRVVETQPSGYFSTGALAGQVNGSPSGLVTSPDVISGITLAGGEHSAGHKFGEALPVTLCGNVYHDADNDGQRDPGEEGIGGVQIVVESAGGSPSISRVTLTNPDGSWCVTDLPPGAYRVRELQPTGWLDGKDAPGTIGGVLDGNDQIAGIVFTRSGQEGGEYNFGELLAASLNGRVFADPNNNVLLEAGETPLPGVTVHLLDAQGNRTGTSTTTDSQGRYRLTGLQPGVAYGVEEVQPAGYFDGNEVPGTAGGSVSSNDRVTGIVLASNESATGYDFGELPPASLTGRVFADPNENCIQENGEPGIGGVQIDLLDANGQPTGISTFTAPDGTYTFTGLAAGVYGVREHQPLGFFDGGETAGTSGGHVLEPGDQIIGVSLDPGENASGYNFCEIPPASISGYVFQDGPPILLPAGQDPTGIAVADHRNGQRTADDRPIANVTLLLGDASGELLRDGAGNPISAVSDGSGFYQFTGLMPGTYTVYQLHPSGYVDGLDTPGTTGGSAANRGNETDPGLAGIDHNFDAIARITVSGGQESRENNFSEVVVGNLPPPPPPPPPFFPEPPPRTPEPQVQPAFFGAQTVIVAPPDATLISPTPTVFYGGGITGSSSGLSWHLSIIDAGHPRGDRGQGDALVQVAEVRLDAFSRAAHLEMTEGRWTLLNVATGQQQQLAFGTADGLPVTGDFNGDGTYEVGLYRGGQWHLDLNANAAWDEGDLWALLGTDRDRPVTGDWDGDGKTDIGIFGPEWPNDARHVMSEPGLPDRDNDVTGARKNLPPKPHEATLGWRQMRRTSTGKIREDLIDHVFYYGTGTDVPLVGDWNGDGVSTIGVFRNGLWILDDNGDGRWLPGETIVELGQPGDLPVVGDWDGDGTDDIGVYRRGTWLIDSNGDRVLNEQDKVFELGGADDLPVTGDWDGDGSDDIGVYHQPGAAQQAE